MFEFLLCDEKFVCQGEKVHVTKAEEKVRESERAKINNSKVKIFLHRQR
jgi:hypothetical protein